MAVSGFEAFTFAREITQDSTLVSDMLVFARSLAKMTANMKES